MNEPGEVVLADRTVVYHILEQMGDPDEAVAHYATVLNLDWLGDVDPHPVRRTVLVPGDRDLIREGVQDLAARFGAVAGDWESGAIAWAAARHRIRGVILRGVTDLVSDIRADAYQGNLGVWLEATKGVTRSLVEQLPTWIDRAAWHEQEPAPVPKACARPIRRGRVKYFTPRLMRPGFHACASTIYGTRRRRWH